LSVVAGVVKRLELARKLLESLNHFIDDFRDEVREVDPSLLNLRPVLYTDPNPHLKEALDHLITARVLLMKACDLEAKRIVSSRRESKA